jgi:hypothetical protein
MRGGISMLGGCIIIQVIVMMIGLGIFVILIIIWLFEKLITKSLNDYDMGKVSDKKLMELRNEKLYPGN